MVPWTPLSFETSPHKDSLRIPWPLSPAARHYCNSELQHDAVVSAEAKKLAATAEAVVLALGFDPDSEGEGANRAFHLPPGQDELVRQIAAIRRGP